MEERVKKLLEKHKDDKDLTSEMDYIEPGWDWSEADLSGWNLEGLKLSDKENKANLQNTKLWSSNLQGAKLQRANLRNARFNEKTILHDVNWYQCQIDNSTLKLADNQLDKKVIQ